MRKDERMRTMTKGRINLSLDQPVIDEMVRMAEKQGISVSQLVNPILKAGLDSTNELVTALDGMSIPALLEVLMKEGRKKKERK